MRIEEIVNRLRDGGCYIKTSQLNGNGRMVHLVQPWDLAVFEEDIDDILCGRGTPKEVIERNRGADLADPWPVASHRTRIAPEIPGAK